ncbi:hydroxypyruvate isomerase family protein [Algoriphagus halophilus]|uniref:Hydroxypyruvate isomerase n=2 Tax=Algoriphagus halophilus TaxID=226505 RepID=A0A1N6D2R3_9BACT|nr:TIM barrel protein [Algoriphagus halophilus]SIN64987.1 hydroxypyruvate isomerase [Algoriphagus halophilus]
MTKPIDNGRRDSFKKLILGGAAFGSLSSFEMKQEPKALKGNINHGVCHWCFRDYSLEDFCVEVKKIGIKGVDLIGPNGWDTLKKHGLDSSMCNGAEISLTEGFGEEKYHDQLVENYTKMIPMVAEAGYKNLICFSGNRRGMDDETGLKNCQKGLERILPLAEKHGVMIQMELLNSKINHKDYLCDKSAFGVELCKRLDSPNFKLLFDIYHMQIDEGDLIRNIRDYHQYFGHYHTAGNPGRNELGDDQEINYPAVMRAIYETGFDGYVSHEFIPKKEDKMASLAEGVAICDV